MPYDTPSPAYGTLSYHVAVDPNAFSIHAVTRGIREDAWFNCHIPSFGA